MTWSFTNETSRQSHHPNPGVNKVGLLGKRKSTKALDTWEHFIKLRDVIFNFLGVSEVLKF